MGGVTLVHEALLYRDLDGFVAGTREFIDAGLAAGEPVMAAVSGSRLDALRSAYAEVNGRVRLRDMAEVGANPARIIPTVREWLDGLGGRSARFVGEPIWPGRPECEAVEGMRHEALLNVAFADEPAAILCPYDTAGLDARVLAEAEHTHPTMLCDGKRWASPAYTDPQDVYAAPERKLTPPPEGASTFAVTAELSALRRFVEVHAVSAGLDRDGRDRLLIAVSEAAANTIRHGGRDGVARVWHDERELVCEIADSGRIVDLLAGRRRPDTQAPGGRGLWLINQLCDFVQLRPSAAGTTLRLHMRLG